MSLHDEDEAAGQLVIEPSDERVVVPVVDRFAPHVGERLVELQRIVDHDEVGPAFAEYGSDRGLAEAFNEHDVAAPLVDLRVEEPLVV